MGKGVKGLELGVGERVGWWWDGEERESEDEEEERWCSWCCSGGHLVGGV